MSAEEQVGNVRGPLSPGISESVERFRSSLAKAREADRYRMLAELLDQLAKDSQADSNGGAGAEVERLSKKVKVAIEENALLADQHRATKADLERQASQLEAEQRRAAELDKVIENHRTRSAELQKKNEELETRLTAKEAELHNAHRDHDQSLLEAQRAELAADSGGRVERLEEQNQQLGREVETWRGEVEQLREDKDAEVAQLNKELAGARSSAGASSDVDFEAIWQRFLSAKPPVISVGGAPTVQSAQRFVDVFVELSRCADDIDKLIRPFVSDYVKSHPPVKVPWDVYAGRDDVRATLQHTLKPEGGRPVGVVKVRLKGLYAWTSATMLASDATVKSIGDELRTFLMGPNGVGDQPNRTIRDFVREGGCQYYLEYMREFLALKLAEAWRGG